VLKLIANPSGSRRQLVVSLYRPLTAGSSNAPERDTPSRSTIYNGFSSRPIGGMMGVDHEVESICGDKGLGRARRAGAVGS
jgi:hypothetical protein